MSRIVRWSRHLSGAMLLLATALAGGARAAEPTLDTMIETGLSNIIKFVRYGAAGILAAMFLWAWSQKAANKDNTHVAHQMNTTMMLTGLGFVAVITYKFILRGFVAWTGADPTLIPDWVWTS